jgi:radical SAM-linked protein
VSRIRLRYEKLGKVRFLSHRDVARCLERAVRKAGLPVAYSQGFSPRARLHFGLALSTGYESLAEFVDVDLDDAAPAAAGVHVDELPDRLSPCLPVGIVVTAAAPIETSLGSLQESVTSCTWQFDVPGVDPGTLAAAAERLLAAREVPLDLVRKGKQVREDLRPLIVELSTERAADGARLVAELGTKPRSVRPAEFFAALGPLEGDVDIHDARVLRRHQWITDDGARREPLMVADPSPHAQVRAS